MNILDYNQFLIEHVTKPQIIEQHRNLYKNIFLQLEDVKPIINEAMELVDYGVFDGMLIENLLNSTEAELYENLFQKA